MVSNVKYEEEYVNNDREMKLFTCRWVPEDRKPKALVFLCHGYAMESSISMQGTANRLAKAGYGVYGIDYVGHGKSDGLRGYVPNFEELVRDCSDHFTKISEKEENKGLKRYLMGESMGGAVVLLLHRKKPDFWDGAVLVAPMCKIADDLKPNPFVINFLTKLANIVPTWRIVPTQDIIDAAVRDPEKKKEVRSNPYWYTGRPRLKTANELLNVTSNLENRLNEVTLPFIVIHGGDDKVTDPAISKLLYETASSSDKTFKLYDGMWHALTYGELPENIDTVFNDIIGWLDKRYERGSSSLEIERKSHEDKNVSSGKPNLKEEKNLNLEREANSNSRRDEKPQENRNVSFDKSEKPQESKDDISGKHEKTHENKEKSPENKNTSFDTPQDSKDVSSGKPEKPQESKDGLSGTAKKYQENRDASSDKRGKSPENRKTSSATPQESKDINSSKPEKPRGSKDGLSGKPEKSHESRDASSNKREKPLENQSTSSEIPEKSHENRNVTSDKPHKSQEKKDVSYDKLEKLQENKDASSNKSEKSQNRRETSSEKYAIPN